MEPDASHQQVRAAYRRAVRELHPDSRDPSLPAAEADAALRLVQGAWDVLGDDRLRRAYDERLLAWRGRPPGVDPTPPEPEPPRARFPWWAVAVAVLVVIFVVTAYAGAPANP